MPLGTTNISIRDIYTEMGKADTTNQSLAELRFGVNDIDNQSFATTSAKTNIGINPFKSYDHMGMKFRYHPPNEYETYRDTSTTLLGAGLGLTNNGTGTGDNTGVLLFDGTNDYSYFDGVGSGTAYKQNPSGYTTICFWIKAETIPSANTNIITTDATGLSNNSPYKGFHFNLTSAGQIRPVRGDGTGTSSSDRRSFGTSFNLQAGRWQLCAFILSNSNNTASSSTNWAYTYWNGGSASGLSFLSGTGGALSFDTGSGSVDALYLSMATNSRYFDGQFGHIWVFDEALSSTDINALFNGTVDYYP